MAKKEKMETDDHEKMSEPFWNVLSFVVYLFLNILEGKYCEKQRYTTNEKPNLYLNIFNKNIQYFDLLSFLALFAEQIKLESNVLC